jgi:dipeptidyl aminopeptidase/acylaminoacyl peptidase
MKFRSGLTALAAAIAAAGLAFAAPPPPLSAYGALPAAEQVEISPDGQMIAYYGFEDGKTKLTLRQIDGPVLAAFSVGEKEKPRAIAWVDDDHVLLETSGFVDSDMFTTNAAEVGETIVINARTRKAIVVFYHNPKVLQTTYGYFGHARINGKSYGYFGGLTLAGTGNMMSDLDHNAYHVSQDHTDLYKVDLDTGEAAIQSHGLQRVDTSWLVDADGKIAAHEEYDSFTGQWRLFADRADHATVASAKDATGNYSLNGLGRTPDSILVQQPYGPDGEWENVEYQPGTGAAPSLPFADDGVRRFLRDPETQLLIGGVTNEDEPKTRLFDPTLQAKFDKVTRVLAGERVLLESATSGLNRMIVRSEGPGDSGTFFLVDFSQRKVEALAWAYPTILQDAVGPVQIVTYKAGDGLEMEGVLTLPPGRAAKGLPVVVLPHGGPEGRDYLGFDWWAQAFASRGYAVFQPNFRGSAGFGKTFRDAGYGEWGRKMQTDVSDGLAELVRRGIVDPKRACIMGASYGGYVALAGVTVQQGLYRCAVSVAGLSDLNAMLFWREQKFGQVNEVTRSDHLFMGVKSAADGSLKAISPAHLAARSDAPILLIHGKDDTVVPIDQSLVMKSALQSAGKPVEFVELSAEDHWLSHAPTRTQMLEASLAFVQKYNPPD